MKKGCRVQVLENTYDVIDPKVDVPKGSEGRYICDAPHPSRYATRPVIDVSLDTGMRARLFKNLVKPT